MTANVQFQYTQIHTHKHLRSNIYNLYHILSVNKEYATLEVCLQQHATLQVYLQLYATLQVNSQ